LPERSRKDSDSVGITTAIKAEQTTASGAPAVLSASTPGVNEADMNKAELLKALEGATECDVKALSEGRAKVVEGKIVVAAAAAEPPVVPAVAEVVTPKVETPRLRPSSSPRKSPSPI
jgi:hypothetical protein